MYHKNTHIFFYLTDILIIKISSLNLWYLHVTLYCLYYSSFPFSKETNEDYKKKYWDN